GLSRRPQPPPGPRRGARRGRPASVPQGRLRIAQRFIAGTTDVPQGGSPVGTAETDREVTLSRPYGTKGLLGRLCSSDESLGYSQPSLRDEISSRPVPAWRN